MQKQKRTTIVGEHLLQVPKTKKNKSRVFGKTNKKDDSFDDNSSNNVKRKSDNELMFEDEEILLSSFPKLSFSLKDDEKESEIVVKNFIDDEKLKLLQEELTRYDTQGDFEEDECSQISQIFVSTQITKNNSSENNTNNLTNTSQNLCFSNQNPMKSYSMQFANSLNLFNTQAVKVKSNVNVNVKERNYFSQSFNQIHDFKSSTFGKQNNFTFNPNTHKEITNDVNITQFARKEKNEKEFLDCYFNNLIKSSIRKRFSIVKENVK